MQTKQPADASHVPSDLIRIWFEFDWNQMTNVVELECRVRQ